MAQRHIICVGKHYKANHIDYEAPGVHFSLKVVVFAIR